MSRFLRPLLVLPVLACFSCQETAYDRALDVARQARENKEQYEVMRERALENNPDMYVTAALEEEALAWANEVVNDPETSIEIKEAQAASAFWGHYLGWIRARVPYCEALSVNMHDFAAEFTEQHSAEIEKATATLSKYDVDRETIWQTLSLLVDESLSQEMEDLSGILDMSTKEACESLNENAAAVAVSLIRSRGRFSYAT